jgi:hypothetical protein
MLLIVKSKECDSYARKTREGEVLCSVLALPRERQWQFRIEPGALSAIDCVVGGGPVHDTVSLAMLNVHSSSLVGPLLQEERFPKTSQSSAEGSS